MEKLFMLCETDAQLLFLETLIERKDLEGIARRVTRTEAKEIFNMTDSAMRCEITRMRANGIPVLSGNQEKGYYFPKDMEEFAEFKKEYLKPAIKRFQNSDIISNVVFNFFNEQVTL